MAAKKRKTRKKSAGEAVAADPREHLPPKPAHLDRTVAELEAVLADLVVPEAPLQSDLVDGMLHILFADGLPCGYGQEARRRIDETFVDRNEFRVTEAYEVEDLMRDLDIPDLFDRCKGARDAVAQVYNDQNGISMDFLREAPVSDRNQFFARIPAVSGLHAWFVGTLLSWEEIVFSDRSTLRVQQRLGLDPKSSAVQQFIDTVRGVMQPFGHLPLQVGPHDPRGQPSDKHVLSPACLLVRLAPSGRKK